MPITDGAAYIQKTNDFIKHVRLTEPDDTRNIQWGAKAKHTS